ncbi:dephospho-CoA kinase [Bacillus sp. B1-b2]|uniref:dephospho-CoA kinase n=1 Tax=Bacillus sp. B1-b2 TaxID=2653201 RepID=UPI0012621641|nr:dephospho-CoA kinase [Bacillus sp. B1-b2]KAB7668020.1 dephospho-CoA kinase [Bacillus sp. B1-b2]
MTLIIGLTGGIASGKSTVSSYYKSLGITIIDADIEARLAVEKGEPAYIKIVEHFGKNILHADETINRQALGEIVFNEERERQVLNSILHPDIRRRMEEKKGEAIHLGLPLVILDIPLLYENKLEGMVDKTILVYVDEDVQIERLMDRNHLDAKQARNRMDAQLPLSSKRLLADEIINNNQSIENAINQAKEILKKWDVFPCE